MSGRLSTLLRKIPDWFRHPGYNGSRAAIVFAIIIGIFVLRDAGGIIHAVVATREATNGDHDAEDLIIATFFAPALELLRYAIFLAPTLLLLAAFRRTRILEGYLQLGTEELDLGLPEEGDQNAEDGEQPVSRRHSPLRRLFDMWLRFLYRAPNRLSLPREAIEAPLVLLIFGFFIRDFGVIWHAAVSLHRETRIAWNIARVFLVIFALGPDIALSIALRMFGATSPSDEEQQAEEIELDHEEADRRQRRLSEARDRRDRILAAIAAAGRRGRAEATYTAVPQNHSS